MQNLTTNATEIINSTANLTSERMPFSEWLIQGLDNLCEFSSIDFNTIFFWFAIIEAIIILLLYPLIKFSVKRKLRE